MKIRIVMLAAGSALIMALALSCSSPPSPPPLADGARLVLELKPGPAYRTTSRWLIFGIPIYPQVACWLETAQGDYVGSIYVTRKGARAAWISAPAGGRPEALPVWSALRSRAAASVEAVSAATPSGMTRRESMVTGELPAGTYTAKLEVNRSYDYNEAFSPGNSGVAGQPSLIYSCQIDVGGGQATASFVPIGTGSPDGSDGLTRPGLAGITTALEILSGATISYLP